MSLNLQLLPLVPEKNFHQIRMRHLIQIRIYYKYLK
jgi:hypothetical protein